MRVGERLRIAMLSGLVVLVSVFQTQSQPHGIDFGKLYGYCLNADVKAALALLDDSHQRTKPDSAFVREFRSRFGESTDESDYLAKHQSPINALVKLYRDYWRRSLLAPEISFDSLLRQDLTRFLTAQQKSKPYSNHILADDTLQLYLKKYITSFGLKTTGFSKTGKLFDLLVWRAETDTTYQFEIDQEIIRSPVVFMDSFITLGWEEYATLDKYYPGGWATREALYCVKIAYNLKSESFLISYLCHEGRHFSDYNLFPNLSSADLEYRAKLTELSKLKVDLFRVLKFFIDNSNYESTNGHAIANHCVVRELSRTHFDVEFKRDIAKWREVGVEQINHSSHELLKANTAALMAEGSGVINFIKKQ